MIELTGIKKDGTSEAVDINTLPQSSQLKIKARFAVKAMIFDYMVQWTMDGDAESEPDEYNACIDELANKITEWFVANGAMPPLPPLPSGG